MNYERDGAMNFGGVDGVPNYNPNSFLGLEPDAESSVPSVKITGLAERHPYVHENSDFVQTGDLYLRVMTDTDRAHLIGNIVSHLGKAQRRIQIRQDALFYVADEEYGSRVAAGLGLKIFEVQVLAHAPPEDRVKATD